MSVNDQFPLASALRQRLQESERELTAGEPCYLLEEVTPVTVELLCFWFQPEFCEMRPLNFHPDQRQAILSIIYAHEVLNSRSLLDFYQQIAPKALLRNGLLVRRSSDAVHISKLAIPALIASDPSTYAACYLHHTSGTAH